MAKVPILIMLLSQLLCTLLEVSAQQSPCPQYFTYITNAKTYEVMGRIEIPYPPKNVELHLKVTLSIAIALPTKYVGKLDLAQSKEESVQRVQQNRPLLYYVYFPLREPLSLLTGIWLNNQEYCSGPSAPGRIVTSITLEHTLYPPNVSVYTTSSTPASVYVMSRASDSIYMTSPTPTSVYTLPSPALVYTMPRALAPVYATSKEPAPVYTSHLPNQPVTISNSFLNNNKCGRSSSINMLIAKGEKTSPGQWPWLAALYIGRYETNFNYICAGSILTNKHIITAAHCIELNKLELLSNEMLICVGQYRLYYWADEGSLIREIASYTLHPDYRSDSLRSSDADLAILTLKFPVKFSPKIRPICMWHSSTDLENIVNQIGVVVGWGNGTISYVEPQMVKMPIVSQEICNQSNQFFKNSISARTFCAGFRDGSGPCNGDSGSGLILYDDTTRRYYLRGIVSIAIHNPETMCDLNNYVVFVDVAKHLLWIQQQISAT